jgi:hypothetical protein
VRLVVRWGLAVAVSAAAFAGAWWVCQERLRLDEAVSLGVAGAVLAVVLAVAGWWAARERPGGNSGTGGWRVTQKVRGGRDLNVAGRDQKINYQRGDK